MMRQTKFVQLPDKISNVLRMFRTRTEPDSPDDEQFVNLSHTVASTVSQKPTSLNQARDNKTETNHSDAVPSRTEEVMVSNKLRINVQLFE